MKNIVNNDIDYIIINRIKYDYTDLEKYVIGESNKLEGIMDEWCISLYNNKKENLVTNIENECIICTNIIQLDKLCFTQCNHMFCYKCICNNYLFNQKCPMCRESLNLVLLKPISCNYYSKLEKLKSNIIKDYNKYSKILIYSKNILLPEISNQCNRFNINNKLLTKKTINLINNTSNIVILVNSSKCNLVKNIRGIKKIIVIDKYYDYILKKQNIGYDFLNKINGIILDIYESNYIINDDPNNIKFNDIHEKA
jgi:hypothetical protein